MDKKKIVLIGGIVVAVGVLAYLLYKSNKNKEKEEPLTEEEEAMIKSAGLGGEPSKQSIKSKKVNLKPNLISGLKAV